MTAALLLLLAAATPSAPAPEQLWQQGTALYEQEDFARSRDTLRRFIALRPEAAAGWAILGMAEYKTGDYPRAFLHLEKAVALGLGERPSLDRSARYLLGTLLTRAERFDEAVQWWLALAPGYEPASSVYREAAGLAVMRMPLLPAELPADRRELVRLAGSALHALSRQQKGEARGALAALVARWPDVPGVHFAFGSYLISYEPDAGLAELRKELGVSPDHAPARVRMAEEYLKRNDTAAALPLAEEAANLEPRYVSARLVCGQVLLQLERIPDAVTELEAARDLSPHDAGIRWALARAYAAAGREADAERERTAMQKLKERI